MQAEKFGAQLSLPSTVSGLSFEGKAAILNLENGEPVRAKAVLVASGAEYQKLRVPGREKFDGAGVYYAATQMESSLCGGDAVVVVGGGNSAGQACLYLAENARKVYLLIRGGDLGKGMSDYLVQRIFSTNNIELLTTTEITQMNGDEHLEAVEIINRQTNAKKQISVAGVFSFIGAQPRTNWINGEIELDAKGFVKTGARVNIDTEVWQQKKRQPFFLETSRPGVFAAGDVRCDSVKRVASSVGEGSMAVQFIHEYLKEMRDAEVLIEVR